MCQDAADGGDYVEPMTLADFRLELLELEKRATEETHNPSTSTTPKRPLESACEWRKGDVYGEDVRGQIMAASKKKTDEPIVISAPRIIGDIDLSGLTLTRILKLENKLICGRVILSGAVLQAGASFKETTILAAKNDSRFGALVAHGLKAFGDVNMSGLKTGAILMTEAEVAGTVRLDKAYFGALDLHNAQAASLVLASARQSNRIALKLVKMIRTLREPETAVKWLGDYPLQFIRGVVRLSDLRLDGQLRGVRFVSEGVTILNDAIMREARFRFASFGALDMRGLNVAADLRLYGATLGLPENEGAQNCALREVPFFDIDFLDLSYARVGRNLLLGAWPRTNGQESRSLATLCLEHMQVAGDIVLSGMKARTLSLRNTSIGGALKFESVGTHDFSATALDLTNSSAATLTVGEATRFPRGSRFNGLAVRNIDLSSTVGSLENSVEDLSPQERIAAYAAFERAYAASNRTEDERDMAYLRERADTETGPIWLRPFRWLADALSGHGLKPWRTLFWTLFALAVGTVAALRAPDARKFLQDQNDHPSAPPTGARRRCFWLCVDAVIFSLDRLIPIVSLNDEHKEIQFRAKRWTRVYFTFHALFGLFLAAAVVQVIGQSLGLSG